MVGKRLFSVIVILLIFSMTAFAATTGKIMGKVIDKNTGKPLAGASVLVEGTSLGAYADSDGSYFILQVPPGVYTVQCQIVGYATVRKQNVVVSVDSTTTVNFQMEEKIAGREEVIVQAKRPIVQKDDTSSSKTFSTKEIERLTDNTVQGAVKKQAGVTEDASGDIHIRGGRDDEVTYIIDGVRMNSGLTGSSAFNLNSDTIQELKILTGGFNAEYGGAQSGIVKVVTKDVQNEYHGSGSYKTSTFGDKYFEQFGEEKYNFSFSGPIPNPFLKASFQFAYQYDDNNGYYLHHPKSVFPTKAEIQSWKWEYERLIAEGATDIGHYTSLVGSMDYPYWHYWQPFEYNRQWTYYGSMAMKPTNKMKIKAVVNKQITHSNQNYKKIEYLFWKPNDRIEKNDFYTMRMTHSLNDKMYYELSLTSQYNAVEQYDEHYENFDGYAIDSVYTNYMNEQRLSYGGVPVYFYSEATPGEDPFYLRYFDEAFKVSAAYTYQFNNYNQFKTGFDYNVDNIEYEVYSAREGDYSQADKYDVQPINMNFFLQDKIEVEDMIMNIGMRAEYYNPNVKYYEEPGVAYNANKYGGSSQNPLVGDYPDEGKIEADTQLYIMPRLGISYPLSDTGVFHFNYGHFYQYPAYQYVYSHIERPVGRRLLGNPELKPQKTVQYEAGFEQGITDVLKFDITGYFKDNSDKLSLNSYESNGVIFQRYTNEDFGRIFGVDFTVTKRFANNFSFDVTYGYMTAKGSNSSATSEIDQLLTEGYVSPVNANYLDFDIRHSIDSTLTFAFGKDEGPEIFNYNILGNTSLTLSGNFTSGLPYGENNEHRMPWKKVVDLKFEKGITVYKDLTASIIVEGENVFNWVNVQKVNPDTGQVWSKTFGRDQADYSQTIGGEYYWYLRTTRTPFIGEYGKPRLMRVGIKLGF